MKYNIAIIGGRLAGYTAAERVGANGLRAVSFEKKAMGGTCLDEGCILTKALLYSARILDSIKSAPKYDVSVGSAPTFDMERMINRKNKTVQKLTGGVRVTVNSYGVTIIDKEVVIEGEGEHGFRIHCDGGVYEATYLMIYTGSDTVIPSVKGPSDIDYWTSHEALGSTVPPSSLAIIGGGVIGMEFASFFNSMGAKVRVIEMMPEILGTMDKETSVMLYGDYTKKGINFYLNIKVTEVSDKGVTVEKDGKSLFIEANQILVSIGRKINITQVGSDKLNIELHRNGVVVDEHTLTSHPRVYACGNTAGHSLLAHTAIREAKVVVNHVLGIDDSINYNCVPSVVYTNPELASVGKTGEELMIKGICYRIQKLPMAYSGRLVAENELGNELCELIVDHSDRVIGYHMLGDPASETIVVAGIAIQQGYTVDEFRKSVFPHSTVGEIYHETLFA